MSITTPRNDLRAFRRYQVLKHYCGGREPYCACCGESSLEFLAIDHIDGGGNKHRANMKRGTKMWQWLLKHGLPAGFRVLCHNCNLAIGFYGACPHQGPGKLAAAVRAFTAIPPRFGSRAPRSILSEDQVREIKHRLRAGETLEALAHAFGRCKATISHIRTGRQWPHVE